MTPDLSAPIRLPRAQHDLAYGFVAHIQAWAKRCNSPQHSRLPLYDAALQLALASAAGHVCLPLASLLDHLTDKAAAPPDEQTGAFQTLRTQLLESQVVIQQQAITPLSAHPIVIDTENRLYLRRYFDLECRLANALLPFIRTVTPERYPPDAIRQTLATLFHRAASASTAAPRQNQQALAVALALQRQLTLISGGPGTGKTTTVATLLACLLTLQPELRIGLAAPTGKAAARMLDALQQRCQYFPAELKARLPRTANTIHRLLGPTRVAGQFRYHATHPLPLDVVVIDEASMLDLSLATHLVTAIPPHARLILLGDRDQLAAVEAGAVFSELALHCAYSPAMITALTELTGMDGATLPQTGNTSPPPPLTDSIVWLSENYRFHANSGIGRLAADINAGRGEEALIWLRNTDDTSIRWIEDDSAGLNTDTQTALEQGYLPYVQALQTLSDPIALFTAFNQFRVLTAIREGPRGLATLNAYLSRFIRTRLSSASTENHAPLWYRGRALIVLQNAPMLGLYNGDIGLCLPDRQGEPAIHFVTADNEVRSIHPARLPLHDDAFALTVHKSQGSEFDHVLLILPATASPVLNRELLYTGITRAAHTLTLSGTGMHFVRACARRTQRHSGLNTRLNEMLSRPPEPAHT